MMRRRPSAPGQGDRIWAGRNRRPFPACGHRVAVKGRFGEPGLATEGPWKGPRKLPDGAQIATSPRKPGQVRAAAQRDCPGKAGQGVAR